MRMCSRTRLVGALAAGQPVSVLSVDTTLTTSQAAEILGVSRPTVVRLLEAGERGYARPGEHRRLKLGDVLAFRDDRQRRSAEPHQLAARSTRPDHVWLARQPRRAR
jgi:excisionase family DNA binding protein